MQLTCPACGLTFPTEARTNTRCRRCRKVVSVSRQTGSPLPSSSESPVETFDESTTIPGQVLAGLGLAGAGAVAVCYGWSRRSGSAGKLDGAAWGWCLFGACLVAAGLWVLVRS